MILPLRKCTAPNGTVLVVPDVPAAFCELARRVLAVPTPAARSLKSIALSGGPTARRCYELLATLPPDQMPAWEGVHIFMTDERCVPIDHPDSNSGMVRDLLASRTAAPATFHPMSCTAGASAYAEELAPHLPLDLVHLGMGPDGHTASIFPGDTIFSGSHDRVPLVTMTADAAGLNPHPRMTLTPVALDSARLAIFTVSGDSKRDAVRALLAGEAIPAASVSADEVVFLVDPSAFGAVP